MPLHTYACEKCEQEFEAVVSIKSIDRVECPECGSERTFRQFSVTARPSSQPAATNCRGDGPPCGAMNCGRRPG